MGGKRGVVLVMLVIVLISTNFGLASAVSVSLSIVNSTFAQVRINDAVDLYGYEINIDSTDSVGTVTFYNFLASDGSSTTKGFTKRGPTVTAYESRLDNQRRGLSGSGLLFNMTYTGELSLASATLIYNDSTQQSISYSSAGKDPGSSTGTGTEGGTGITYPVTVDKETLHVIIKPGETKRESVIITNDGLSDLNFNFEISLLSDYILVDREDMVITAGQSGVLNLDFFAGEGVLPGVYTGRLYINVGNNIAKSVNIILEVGERSALFDISSTIDSAEYYLGDKLTARIRMINIGDVDVADVILHYYIKDFSGNEYGLGEETVGVDGEIEITRLFDIPTRLEPGDYAFTVKLTTVPDGQIATAASPFSVIGPKSFDFFEIRNYLVGVIIVLIIFVIGLISYQEAKRSKKHRNLHGHLLLRRAGY